MKKLIIAAVALCAAVVTQAATVSWSASGLVDINGVGLKSSDMGAFTIVCTIWDADGNVVCANTEGNKVNPTSGAVVGAWKSALASTQYYTQLVITDKAGNTLTSEKASFTTDSSATYKPNFATGDKFDTAGAKIGTTKADWVAAPEPTSGMLLLLGVAGLALRRRRA